MPSYVEAGRQSFNWVEARATIDLKDVFKRLRAVIQDDVASAKEVVPERRVVLDDRTHREFRVGAGGTNCGAVRFRYTGGDGIKIKTGREVIVARACLSRAAEDGTFLDIGGEAMRLHEVSRRALEGLIFEGR